MTTRKASETETAAAAKHQRFTRRLCRLTAERHTYTHTHIPIQHVQENITIYTCSIYRSRRIQTGWPTCSNVRLEKSRGEGVIRGDIGIGIEMFSDFESSCLSTKRATKVRINLSIWRVPFGFGRLRDPSGTRCFPRTSKINRFGKWENVPYGENRQSTWPIKFIILFLQIQNKLFDYLPKFDRFYEQKLA